MKIDCDIIKDLLPLYAEGLVSEKSRNAVEEYLKECDIDFRQWTAAFRELLLYEISVNKRTAEKNAQPLFSVGKVLYFRSNTGI